VESGFYNRAKKLKEIIELNFTENNPVVKTGLTEFKINHLYILPIFYNNNLLAIMELASVNKPKINIKDYLNKIEAQLAIGLANGKALTELKMMVNELQKLNSAYQKQNLEITEKNEELVKLHDKLKEGSEELEVQTAKAVESEKVKSQFLANMSHELRTPQNSILGLTELILKDETTPVQTRERLNVVLRNGKKLLTLIENILEYSKLESGNTELKESAIYLNDLVDEVYSFIYPLFIETNIDFKIEIPQDYNYEIISDIKKIEQIIYNLIGNAIKFTSEGFVKLELKVEENNLEINVEDTGPGISEEDQKIIFEEFRQVDGNLNRKFSGSGLGLAICKRYTELLNGEISLQSNLGKGSIFKISIPNIIKSKISLQKESAALPYKNNNLSALIVSDGYDSIKLISDYLITHHIEVDVITSEEIEIENVKDKIPDIIIIDILFADKNGWNFLTELKLDSTLKSIPVVVVNMDEEANCGLGLKVFEFCAEKLNRSSINNYIKLLEHEKSLQLNSIHLLTNKEKFNKIKHEMDNDYIELYSNVYTTEPEIFFIDLFNNEINSFDLLSELNNNLATKEIPVIAFIPKTDAEEKKYINNIFFETTLMKQYHPLDVLKVIKDRIELFDSSVFGENVISQKEGTKQISHVNKIIDSKIKVLIVDDDSDARFTIGEIMKTLNYEPIFATNGYECLEKLTDEMPNLILLDIMMPKMDGFQTIKKIREIEEYKELKVYALTAYAMLSDKEIIEKNGFNGLFTKPINTVQLERKLTNIFNTAI
jgi:signal transduction histidine kinase/CheY-like chemotaxis protein